MEMHEDDIAKRIIALSPEKRALLEQLLQQHPETKISPVDYHDATYPLSFAQQRLWFLSQLQPDNPVYNVGRAYELEGVLNIDAFKQALWQVVLRHELLRSLFLETEPPQQQAVDNIDLPFDVFEFATEQALIQKMQSLLQQPFNLQQAPLFRSALLTAPQRQVFVLVFHHIISDAWAMSVFYHELQQYYLSACQQQTLELPELALTYREYVHWQRQSMQGEKLQKLIHYWQQQLADIPVLALATDYPYPAIQNYCGQRAYFQIDATLLHDLKQYAQTHNVTLFMVLLMAYYCLLQRYSGQQDIVIGTPIANRTQADFETLFGPFINNLALRLNISGNTNVEDAVLVVRDIALQAYVHQDLAFEKLVEILPIERDLSHTPIFQVMLVLQNMADTSFRLDGVSLRELNEHNNSSKFDLTLTLTEKDKVLEGFLEYSSDLFHVKTIQRMIKHWQILLQNIVSKTQLVLSQLGMLTEKEQQQLLYDWNPIYIENYQQQSIHECFLECAAKRGDAIAVSYQGQTLTYQELEQKSNQLAYYLQQQDAKPNTLIAVCLPRSLELIVALLAILKSGAAYLPLEPDNPVDRLKFIVTDANAIVILTDNERSSIFVDFALPVICIDEITEILQAMPMSVPTTTVNSNDLAYVIYTSGSTGKPKGVLIPHKNVMRLFSSTRQWFSFNSQDIWLLFHSYTFDVSVWEIWGALLHGGRLLIISHSMSRDPFKLLDVLEKEKVTVLNQTPSAFYQLIQAHQQRPLAKVKLRYAIFAGEALDPTLVKFWFDKYQASGGQLINMYGPTEATVYATYHRLSHHDVHSTVTKSPIGRPLPDLQFYVLDQYQQLVPVGVVGELYIAGAGLASGYLNRAQLTNECFIQNPYLSDHQRLYKTGDLVMYRDDGVLEYIGRIDQQIKLRGYRIELGEIETTLEQLDDIQQAVVIMHQFSADQRLVAYIVSQKSNEPVWRQLLLNKLPEYMLPALFIVINKMPLTLQGKIDKSALPNPGNMINQAEAVVKQPRNDVEQQLVKIWESLLNRAVGIHDNFFRLGGHSLLVTQLVNRILAQFSIQLSISLVFQNPTIAQLSPLINISNEVEKPTLHVELQQSTHSGKHLFMVYGVGATHHALMHYFPDYSIVLFNHQAMDGQPATLFTIESIAENYVQKILQNNNLSTCLICGHSVGGVVAYEIAQQLAVIDSNLSILLCLLAPSSLQVKRQENKWQAVRSMGREIQLKYWEKIRGHIPTELHWRYINGIYNCARQSYHPKPYYGDVLLFSDTDTIESNQAWLNFMPKAEVIDLPCGHLDMLRAPYLDQWGNKIKRWIMEK